MATSSRKQNGMISVLMAVSMMSVLAIVGLAFSLGLSYMIKAKLNAATDAAALAAARATSNGASQAEQTANAKAAATRFFNANFPSGYLGSTATLKDAVVTFNGTDVAVSVSASATMPTSLMGNYSTGPMSPGVLTETRRQDLDMILTLDTSGSLSGSASNVRSSAVTFLKQFNSQRDRVGLVHFAYGSVIDDPIQTTARGFNRTNMETHINALSFSGSTASVEGMWRARLQLDSVVATNNNRSNLRVIVFFSDGAPNSLGANLVWNTANDCSKAGTITTDDDGSGEPRGLYNLDAASSAYTDKCNPHDYYDYSRQTGYTELADKAKLPNWYNAHDANAKDIAIVTNSPRVVTNTITYQNVNRAARNVVEAMAAKAQDDGVYVFTLGLGSQLKVGSGYDGEKGEDTLKCMANSVDAPSRCSRPAKPVGVYCYAATQADLTPCFSKLASAILRISK